MKSMCAMSLAGFPPGTQITDRVVEAALLLRAFFEKENNGKGTICGIGIKEEISIMEETFSFSFALEMVKSGKRMARKGWNGRGMFIFLVPGSTFKVNLPPLLGIYPEGTEIKYHAHVDMKTADGMVVPWLCSQTDMLAEDWVQVE